MAENRICSVEGCGKVHYGNGYCHRHYRKFRRVPKGPILVDLSGQVFGRLTALERIPSPNGTTGTFWRCACSCGSIKVTRAGSLTKGQCQSCGCQKRERTAARKLARPRKARQKVALTYSSWTAMRARCLNPEAKGYRKYGARGITIHPRWSSYDNFLSDMGERPEGTTLDRIDNNGNYEPGNCRWATPKVQGNNTRQNHMLEFGGKRQSISMWGDELGIKPGTIQQRLNVLGWSVEKTLTTKAHLYVVRPRKV